MKKVVLSVAAALTLGAVSFAMAGGVDQIQAAPSHAGLYVGGGLGAAMQTMPSKLFVNESPSVAGGFAVNDQKRSLNHFAADVHVGYMFDIAQNFLLGAELGYNYLPQSKYTFSRSSVESNSQNMNIKYSNYAFNLMGVAKYYVTDQINVFGKAGIAYEHQQITQTTPKQTGVAKEVVVKASKGKVLPKLAVGVGYNVTPAIELTAEYSHTFGNKVQIKDANKRAADNKGLMVNGNAIPSNNVVMVGMNYHFNI